MRINAIAIKAEPATRPSPAEREVTATFVSANGTVHDAIAARHLNGTEDLAIQVKHDPRRASTSAG